MQNRGCCEPAIPRGNSRRGGSTGALLQIGEKCFDHVGPEPIPSRDAVIDVVQRICRILYPGYFIRTRLEQFNLSYYFGQEATALFEHLSEQVTVALRHDCIRHNLPCVQCEDRGQQITVDFMGGCQP